MNVFSSSLALALAGIGLWAVGSPGNAAPTVTPATVASPSAAPSGAPMAGASAAAGAVVDTKNFAYAPPDLTVAVGTSVKFTNSDAVGHTVTADDGSFDSSEIAGGQSWSHVFAKAGTYKYFCAYHRYMRGTVTVK